MSEKLKEEDAKKYKIVSRILGIIARIGNVCCWIGVGCVALTTIATAVVAPNVKVNTDAKELSVFDQTVNYSFKDKEIEIGEGKDRVTIKNNEIVVGENGSVVSIKLSDESIEEIEKFVETDAMRLLSVLPYVLAFATVAVAFIALALGHIASVFKNIAKEKSPFIEDNATRLESAARYLIISYAITLICNIIMDIVMNGKGANYGGGIPITSILTLYVAVYVIKYGIDHEAKKVDAKAKKED